MAVLMTGGHLAPPELMQRARRDECAALDRLLGYARGGHSGVLVLRGEAGVGKTALLEYAIESASDLRVLRAVGVQSERELAYAALHQLCGPMLDGLGRLPGPQRDALATTFGLSAGPVPERLLVSLATLSLVSEMAHQRPLVCVIDGAQWLDRASAQVLTFVARRLVAESVVLLFAAREPDEMFSGLPELVVEGLADGDARELLASVLPGPLDEQVAKQLLAETRGNPLALLELPRGLTPAQLAGGFGLPGALSIQGKLEERFLQTLGALPEDTQQAVLLVAADPVGNPLVLRRAADSLGIARAVLEPAEKAGLLEIAGAVRFRHPLVRSAVYGAAAPEQRRRVHRALAEATDPQSDPDRRAWHLAEATAGPDEDVAGELENAAGRAQARGGSAAAAAFLERAAALTPDPDRRAVRLLTAARAKRHAGAFDEALTLLGAMETAPDDALLKAHVERLRGQIALEQRRGSDAVALLLSAATSFDRLDVDLARATHLESLVAAWGADDLHNPGGLRAAAEAARAAPAQPGSPRAVDVLLDAFATRIVEGYGSAAPLLRHARDLIRGPDGGLDDDPLMLSGTRPSFLLAFELWDSDTLYPLVERLERAARSAGDHLWLRVGLNVLATTRLLAGDLASATLLADEDRRLSEAMGSGPMFWTPMLVAAWRGRQPDATDQLIEAAESEAAARDLGAFVGVAEYARSVLANSLGRHQAARDAARRLFDRDSIGRGPMAVPELVEAAARVGDMASLEAALQWLSERTRLTPTDWSLGIEARARALVASGEEAEHFYLESIERLARTPIRTQLSRAHLLYGEWLRRERRRLDARDQLRTAFEMFTAMGTEAFAARAERELLATGEHVRKRSPETRDELTPQEAQIARLARDGLSNADIGTRLFISQHTVAYHLRKVFNKLDITSRNQLGGVLPPPPLERVRP
jgi:DNA-binding CsgD family transcriptional regulator